MKRILCAIALIGSLMLSTPTVSQAKHHRKHRAVKTRVVYVPSAAPREHGVNANVGVGIGPLHVGGNAGVGVH